MSQSCLGSVLSRRTEHLEDLHVRPNSAHIASCRCIAVASCYTQGEDGAMMTSMLKIGGVVINLSIANLRVLLNPDQLHWQPFKLTLDD